MSAPLSDMSADHRVTSFEELDALEYLARASLSKLYHINVSDTSIPSFSFAFGPAHEFHT